MAEGSAALAGGAGGAGEAGGAGGAGGAGEAGAAGAAGAAGSAGAAGTWTEGFDADANGYVAHKGWGGPADVVASYRNLEKLQHHPPERLLQLPEEGATEGWDEVHAKLGRPEKAEAYEFEAVTVQEGGTDLTPQFKEMAHKHGLSQRAAAGIFTDYNAMVAKITADQEEAVQLQSDQDMADLRKEWGQGYDTQVQAGIRFAARYGITQETMNQIEGAMGTKALMQLFAKVGGGMGEMKAPADGDPSVGGFGLTPEMAKHKLEEIKKDKAFMDRYMAGDLEAKAKWVQLHNAIHPEPA